MPTEKAYPIESFNNVIRKANRFQTNRGDLWSLENGEFQEIGSINKSGGYGQRGSNLTTTTSTSTSSSTTTTSTSTSSSSSTSSSTTTS